ncbi:54S ribosomal protein L22, mitochondrial [Halocaridina rubra]|uniref:Large ribosomal subunit protein uL22m n=1 Tax=Halocaridina rubra TaxID=373956 RepID=A0AAN8X2L1_HALRR
MLSVIRQTLGVNTLSARLARMSIGGSTREHLFNAPYRSTDVTIPISTINARAPSICGIHTSALYQVKVNPKGPSNFIKNNDVVYPPTPLGEKERPAFVCYVKENIRYSPKKMWYIATHIRGMRIDDAINQLKFVHKIGAVAVREALEEAQELAVKEHNVEFRSNLWVSESFSCKGRVMKGYRRHARKRFGNIEYKYCHYFVTLEEGDPPEHYYPHTRTLTAKEMLEEWMEDQRQRRIPFSL